MKNEMKAAKFFGKVGEKKLAAHERREAMGKEKDTPAIAKKEEAVMKKKGAPKDVKDYEMKEHKAMKYAEGGDVESSRDYEIRMARARGGQPDYTKRGVREGTAKAGMAALSALPVARGIGTAAKVIGRMSTTDKALMSAAGILGGAQTATEVLNEKERREKEKQDKENKVKDSEMKNGGKYARGGGIESKGKTQGKAVRMNCGGTTKKYAKGGGIESKGKTKCKYR